MLCRATWGYARQLSTQGFQGRTKELPLGQQNGAKSLWAATGLDGKQTAAKAKKGQGGHSGGRKDQRCVFRRVREHSLSDGMSKRLRLVQFFSFPKTKLHEAAGGRGSTLQWTKGLSVLVGGQEGGRNSKRGTMALWESKLTRKPSVEECMANQTPTG